MSFTNRRHPDLYPSPHSPASSSLHKLTQILSLSLPCGRDQLFFSPPRKEILRGLSTRSFVHARFGNEPVSISMGNREQRRGAARLFVVLVLRNNSSITSAMVADRNAVASEMPTVGLVAWQDRVFSSLGGMGKLAPRGNCSVITSSNNFLRDITYCCLQASLLIELAFGLFSLTFNLALLAELEQLH